MYSEFSGYGTAEMALESVMNTSAEKLRCDPSPCKMSSADISTACQKLLLANRCRGSGCVFGDILSLLGDELRGQLCSEVVETFVVTREDVAKAVKALQPKSTRAKIKKADVLFTAASRLKCKLGSVPRDYAIVGVEGAKLSSPQKAILKMTSWLALPSASKRTASFKFSRRSGGCIII